MVLVGDSTMAPRTGYGNAFCGLFLWQVECRNLARGGRSTKSYRVDGSWEQALAAVRGRERTTFVLIQFGHNDQPGKAERSTDLATEYPANLRRYVEETRRAGATPVLVSPLARRSFASDGTLRDDLAPWAAAAAQVARETGTAFLDLHAASVAAVTRLGPGGADSLAMASAPHPDFDRTHVGPRGAALFARILAREVAASVPVLAAGLVVGALEPDGRIARPELTALESKRYRYASVLGSWDPLAAPDSREADLLVDGGSEEGPGRFRTVQAAVIAAMARGTGSARVTIRIRPGDYRELVYVPASAPPIPLAGEGDAAGVRIGAALDATMRGKRYAEAFGAQFARAPKEILAMFDALRARETIGTAGSAAVWVRSRGFEARNLTFLNLHNQGRGDSANQSQAVALMLDDADEAALRGVRLVGYQDTLYLAATSPARPARAFIHRSYIEGDMDFIFGEATAFFLETEIRSLGDRAISYALAPSTHYLSRHGFVFERCRFTHDGSENARAGTFKLARQWNRGPSAVGKVAILDSVIGAHIDANRPWADWSIGTSRHRRIQYDSDEHWERLASAGVDPVRELGYPPRGNPPEPFLVEYNNSTEGREAR